jgi:hypothetical protein
LKAFVVFVQTYAIWLYLLCALGILAAIKILADARRLARTTLFSLDLERAGERTFRAVLLILVLLAAIGAVTSVNAFLGPAAPAQEPAILRGATPTLSALIFPTATPLPSSTPTVVRPTETPFMTSTPVVPTLTRTPAKATIPAGSQIVATPAAVQTLPPPVLEKPVNGMVTSGKNQAGRDLTFRWSWKCDRCFLGPDDRFVIVISFVDRVTGNLRSIANGPRNAYDTMANIMGGTSEEVYQRAKDDLYQWHVEVRRGEQPLTASSETWKFIWH